jgi:ribose-phosphate pyrophosphokinase
MQVIGGSLGRRIADILGADYVPIEERAFPDGEVNFRILGSIDREVILVLRKKASEHMNSYLVKLYFLTKTLHDADANISLVMPYFVYARQDKVFRKGEPLSSQFVADLFDPLVSRFITVTPHTHRRDSILPMFKHAKAVNVSGIPALAKALPELSDTFVLGPDTESIVWAKEMAEIIGADGYGSFDKKRDLSTGEIHVAAKDFDLQGKNLVMVDDMVSTGGTTVRAANLARRKGIKELHVSFVHPVLSGNALEKLRSLKAESVIATNTIESPVSVADVAPLVAKSL